MEELQEVSEIELESIRNSVHQIQETYSILNTTLKPDIFFGRLGFLFDTLLFLQQYEKYGIFTENNPTTGIKSLEIGLHNRVDNFIKRYMNHACKVISKIHSKTSKEEKYGDLVIALIGAFDCADKFWIGSKGKPHYTKPLFTKENFQLVQKIFDEMCDNDINDIQFPTYAKKEPKEQARNLPPKKIINPIYVSKNAHKAALVIFGTKQASISTIQNSLKFGFAESARIIKELEEIGVVGPLFGTLPRKILINQREYISRYRIVSKTIFTQTPPKTNAIQNPTSIVQKQENLIKRELSRIDKMDGHTFEKWCAKLLEAAGFTDVKVTKKSGDQGVDVLATMEGGVRYAVQCKCYSSDLGNKPIQEVYAGIAMYNCQVGCVMTNRYFTAGAKELANATGISLWDRDWITSLLEELDASSFPI